MVLVYRVIIEGSPRLGKCLGHHIILIRPCLETRLFSGQKVEGQVYYVCVGF